LEKGVEGAVLVDDPARRRLVDAHLAGDDVEHDRAQLSRAQRRDRGVEIIRREVHHDATRLDAGQRLCLGRGHESTHELVLERSACLGVDLVTVPAEFGQIREHVVRRLVCARPALA
ncbi:MAG: hypothetical protein ACK559_01945, partial [bacterium]